MKKVILLSAMASSILLATNGDNLISLGAESRAMGGTGIAMPMGTDSVFKNPSWLADVKYLSQIKFKKLGNDGFSLAYSGLKSPIQNENNMG